ncbi:MAG TPA: bifunctional 4-hydroxy-2-oxoglutarate aldolase/2-dehydro-3-deoxy-phosphogluconate aldolase [Capillimicrobium sp.]|nr:bifunctional 4-hydroxy-2-oxoglutarate aldolase/2-dehydro-3-deoxy-phosphogluconate aldolase [Capillimicrobium sp.]
MSVTTQPTVERLRAEGLLAVLRAPSAAAAVRTAHALADGGIAAIEVTFTTPGAPEAIAELAQDPRLFVGAGTVRDARQAEAAIDAGAAYLVSPGLLWPVVDAGEQAGVLTLPGVLTPTEVAHAAERVDVLKLFPASVGGPAYLKALLAPFPDLRLVPTGGVNADNLGEWRAAGAFALGAGGDLCPSDLIAAGDFAAVTDRARRYRAALDRMEA